MSAMPIILIVLDGLGDRQQPGLDDRTPLEAARTPALDALAKAGSNGLMWPVGPGRSPTSPLAHFVLFGYAESKFPGRGLIEALGEGLAPAAGEVVCRANFVQSEIRDGVVIAAGRPDPRLGAAVNADVDLDCCSGQTNVRFVHTGAAQGLVFLSPTTEPLSPEVTDADPLREGSPVRAVRAIAEASERAAAERVAESLNAWMLESRNRLEGRELDMAVVKWAAARPPLARFIDRTGLRGVTLARGMLYKGLAELLGMDVAGRADTGDPAMDLVVDVDLALDAIREGYDFVHVHTKWPDSAGHRKVPERKRDVIELLDGALGERLERLLSSGAVICVTADHQTPSSGPLYHSGGAVPLLVCGGAAGRDGVSRFSELACRDGALGHITGRDLMPLLLDCAERSAFLGAERYTVEPCMGTASMESIVPLRLRPSEA